MAGRLDITLYRAGSHHLESSALDPAGHRRNTFPRYKNLRDQLSSRFPFDLCAELNRITLKTSAANLLGNFGPALTYEVFIHLGLVLAIPVSAGEWKWILIRKWRVFYHRSNHTANNQSKITSQRQTSISFSCLIFRLFYFFFKCWTSISTGSFSKAWNWLGQSWSSTAFSWFYCRKTGPITWLVCSGKSHSWWNSFVFWTGSFFILFIFIFLIPDDFFYYLFV